MTEEKEAEDIKAEIKEEDDYTHEL